ncbi:SRPBCC family protein [Rothia uropygialis]|uniref:SRPBCC family protein n=1 Tax=Kocuria sp. 36 TaxID=1415402 RepID=UPI00101E19CB|nr:SRPBCC family protein [Kocuria sp. 36]
MSDNTVLGGLKGQVADYAQTLGRKAISSASGKVDQLADRFDGNGGSGGEAAKAGAQKIAEGESPAKAAVSAATAGAKDKVKGVFGGGSSGGSGSSDNKFMNIVEWAEVGVPLSVAYNAFTQFEDWPDFMKKVESVERTEDTKLKFKGQVFWSHRTWEATIVEQVPDSHIVWESTGDKGYISGSVSFHEVAPRLTRMVVIGEYHPQGFMERTGNIWRAVGRRFRLEMKFFVHHVMTDTILDPDGVEGWRGEIRDSELVTSHEDALEEEQEADQENESEEPQDEENSEDFQDQDSGEDEDELEEPAEEEADYVEEEDSPEAEEEPVEDEPAGEGEDVDADDDYESPADEENERD